MCAAVSGAVRPENEMFSVIVKATVSTVKLANPVAGDALAGLSLAPLRVPESVTIEACATDPKRSTPIASENLFICPPLWGVELALSLSQEFVRGNVAFREKVEIR